MFLAFLSSATRRRGTLDHVVRCPKNRVAAAASETVYAAWLTLHNLWTMKHRSAERRTEAMCCTGIGKVEPLHNYLLSSPLHRMCSWGCVISCLIAPVHMPAQKVTAKIFLLFYFTSLLLKLSFFNLCAVQVLPTLNCGRYVGRPATGSDLMHLIISLALAVHLICICSASI